MIKKSMICRSAAVIFTGVFLLGNLAGCGLDKGVQAASDSAVQTEQNDAVKTDQNNDIQVDENNDIQTGENSTTQKDKNENGNTEIETGCPYSELNWASNVDDMIALEGDKYETYDSIYKGMTYTYPKAYLEKEGIIKYMYDGDGKLCNISWSYAGDTADDVLKVYRAVCDDTEKLHGGGSDDNGVGNYCMMWKRDEGTIMVNAVITNDTTVMQIAYMSAEVSHQ